MRALAMIALAGACGGRQPALAPAGSDRDDGHGLLARASVQFLTADASEDEDLFAASGRAYGGDAYGGDAYGGGAYAGYIVPAWPSTPVNRTPRYSQRAGLAGSIEGVIAWRGKPPARLTTACGAVEPLRVGADRGVADVLVYIERVQIGRTLPNDGRPVSIGGNVIKRGCSLAPIVQLVTPLPAAVALHGDARRARFRITVGKQPPSLVELQEAGRAGVQVQPGVTRIESEDGTVGSAWVVAIDTPYYAITDDRGRFRLDELAAGTYQVTIWQAPIATLVKGKLTYGAPVVVKRTVKVDAARSTRLDVALGR